MLALDLRKEKVGSGSIYEYSLSLVSPIDAASTYMYTAHWPNVKRRRPGRHTDRGRHVVLDVHNLNMH